jgi:tetratricopeptide (TPR) repeat protein
MKPDMDLSGLIGLVNANPSSESFITLSHLYQLRGEWNIAEYWLYRAINFDPYNSSNWLELGSYYRILSNWDLALKAFNRALVYEPASVSALLALGSVQEQLDMPSNAMEAYQQAIEIEPGRIDGYVALANLQLGQGDSKQPFVTIQDGILRSPTDYRGYDTLGKLFAGLGETTEALEAYKTGLRLIPGAVELYTGIADLYAQSVFRASTALEIAEAFEKGATKRVEEKEKEQRTAITRKEKNKSRLTLIHAMEDYIDYQNKLLYAQRSFQQAEADLESAVENYNKALEFQPDNDAALRGLGKLSLVSRSPEEAVNLFYDAVAANPNSTLSSIYLGFTYLDLNQNDRAIEVFQDLLKYDPNNLFAHLGMAKALSSLEVIGLSQAAASVEQSQFFWDSIVSVSRGRGRD